MVALELTRTVPAVHAANVEPDDPLAVPSAAGLGARGRCMVPRGPVTDGRRIENAGIESRVLLAEVDDAVKLIEVRHTPP